MKSNIRKSATIAAFVAATLTSIPSAHADKLDDVISAKRLRCGVQLDFPPAGYRNEKNEPEGFDVQYCKDLAKALGVAPVVVETPSAERIPALVSNRIDVLVASTSPTLERAKTVAFTVPYNAFDMVVLTRNDSKIEKYEDLKGRTIAGVTGTTNEKVVLENIKAWGDPGTKYVGYNSEAETFLAVAQGKADGVAVVDAVAAALIQSKQFPNLVVKGTTPIPTDFIALAVNKKDTDFLRWLNMAVWEQVRSGRFKELREKYIGGSVPNLTVPSVYY